VAFSPRLDQAPLCHASQSVKKLDPGGNLGRLAHMNRSHSVLDRSREPVTIISSTGPHCRKRLTEPPRRKLYGRLPALMRTRTQSSRCSPAQAAISAAGATSSGPRADPKQEARDRWNDFDRADGGRAGCGCPKPRVGRDCGGRRLCGRRRNGACGYGDRPARCRGGCHSASLPPFVACR